METELRAGRQAGMVVKDRALNRHEVLNSKQLQMALKKAKPSTNLF
jgi:hypothetical protein